MNAYLIRDAETGYAPPGIPAWRRYATERQAKGAARRAAKANGRPVAYGWTKPGSDVLKVQCGVAEP